MPAQTPLKLHYPIHFEASTAALRAEVAALRSEHRPLRVFADAVLLDAWPHFLHDAGFTDTEVMRLPSGERTKSIGTYAEALSFLAAGEVNRDGAVFAFGGGVVGDLAGFVAASYLRGVDFYQIPSTLLAMVDSSVGGKTGLNLPEGKNLVGAFWQPKAVFVAADLLSTLPSREFAAGMAEVIKYGLLADAELFQQLEALDTLDPASAELPSIIRRCCAIKADVVAVDEKETAGSGGRARLNLGHTFAHAIENVAGYGEYLHGEAVAIGLVLAARLSAELGEVDASLEARTVALLHRYDLPTALRQPLDTEALMGAMRRDKKNRADGMRFITLEALGLAVTREGVDPARIRRLLDTL